MIGKLLIVDDEAWFRDGLMMLISNEQLGWEVVGEASDGEEALAMIETTKPDLIITDIHMPVVDGLMLTKTISEMASDIMVIILTGYRDFDYAQRALRYGAVEFLLKPLSLPDTCEVLRKSYDVFKQKQLQKKLRIREKQVETLRAALYRLPYDKQEWDIMNTLICGYHFYLLRVNHFFPKARSYEEKDVELLHYAISNIVAELLPSFGINGLFISLYSGEFAFLLEKEKQTSLFCETVTEQIYLLLSLDVEWYEGGRIDQLDQLALAFSVLRSNLQHQELPSSSEATLSFELRERLLSDLIIGDVNAARTKINHHIDQLTNEPLHICKTAIYPLVTALTDLLANEFKHIKANQLDEWSASDILLFKDRVALLEWVSIKAESFLQLFSLWLLEKQDNVVARSKQFIETNYKENCSLQTVAAHVHVTPNYLSNLFKKETGIAFSNYVSKVRVEKAKALLSITKMRMSEIAEQTGFDNSSYFTTVFKQLTMLSPSEYRKEYGN